MRKRLRKKVDKKYISDLCYEISTSDAWVDKLVEGEYNIKYPVDRTDKSFEDKDLKKAISKYDLEYHVSKIYPSEAKDFLASCNHEGFPIKYDPEKLFLLNLKDESEEGILFKVESQEFPEIYVFSLNIK